EPQSFRADLPLSADATIADPVLIDPLAGKVYQLEGAALGEDRLTVANMPLLDYPLLVTDRSVVLG
ncbi:MAG: hypothetical protein U1E05_05880, partial [Patescibacteria group bacterium]|nr:hypothetical protein [Patescibacteria group bacterium]